MRCLCLVLGVVLFALLPNERAFAQNVSGILAQTGTGQTTFTINRATTSTFQLDLRISPTFDSVGLNYFVQTGANGSGLFSVTARSIATSPYSDPNTSDSFAFAPMNGLLNPVNRFDLGATLTNIQAPNPPNQYFVATLTFAISPNLPVGTYTLFLDNRGQVMDRSYNCHPLAVNTVTINVVDAAVPLSLDRAVSRKAHGSVGTFDIDLPLTGQPGVECRNTGGDHTLVFTFSTGVVAGSATLTAGSGSVAGGATFTGHTMTVELTNVADEQKLAVKLQGVTDVFGQVLPDTTVNVNMLIGDTTSNRTVNSSDIIRIKELIGTPVTADTFRADINGNGSITASDLAQSKANSGHTLP